MSALLPRPKAFEDLESFELNDQDLPLDSDSSSSDAEQTEDEEGIEFMEEEDDDCDENCFPKKDKRSSSVTSLHNSGCINSLDSKEVNVSVALFLQDLLHNPQTSTDHHNKFKQSSQSLSTNATAAAGSNQRRGSIFDENKYPLTPDTSNNKNDDTTLPTIQEIYHNVLTILLDNYLPPQVSLLAMAYIEKFVQTSKIRIVPSNYRRVLLAAVVLATKMWEDAAIWNSDFVSLFPKLNITDLNHLERQFLNRLDYETVVSAMTYAQQYFDLREISKLNNLDWKPVNPNNRRRKSITPCDDQIQNQQKKIKTCRSKSIAGLELVTLK